MASRQSTPRLCPTRYIAPALKCQLSDKHGLCPRFKKQVMLALTQETLNLFKMRSMLVTMLTLVYMTTIDHN